MDRLQVILPATCTIYISLSPPFTLLNHKISLFYKILCTTITYYRNCISKYYINTSVARALLGNQQWFCSHQLNKDRSPCLQHAEYYWTKSYEKSQLLLKKTRQPNSSSKKADTAWASFRTPFSTAKISNSNLQLYTCVLIPLIFKVFMNTLLKIFSIPKIYLNSCSVTKQMFSTLKKNPNFIIKQLRILQEFIKHKDRN